MRFRRSVKLFPSIKLNVSKQGISTSMGTRGASITFGSNGNYLNYGIPETGIYDRIRLDSNYNKGKAFDNVNIEDSLVPNYQEIEIKSKDIDNLTSSTLAELQDMLKDCYIERNDLAKEIHSLKTNIVLSSFVNAISKLLIFGFFINWFSKNVKEKKEYLSELDEQLDNCLIDIDISIEEGLMPEYNDLCSSFYNLCSSRKIWSVNSYHYIDSVRERASYGTVVNKQHAEFSTDHDLSIIKTAFQPLSISNANISLYIYPSFVLVLDKNKKIGLIEFKDIKIRFTADHFVEDGQVPEDSRVLYYTWHRSNKDGSPDLRFKDNYQIPVCQYGRMDFESTKGLNESFQVSCYDKTKLFADSFERYTQQFILGKDKNRR